jgi:nucleoside-diphosphate-sugar epimerase
MILVTGASGFVGSALITRLSAAGRPVLAGMRSAGNATAAGVPAREVGDLGTVRDLRAAFEGVSCIVHAAARVHQLDDRAADPLAAFRQVNVAGTCALAQQAHEAGVRRFVFVSSIKVNGEATAPGRPFTSADAPQPLDAYGISKHEAEIGLRALAARIGLEVVVVRPTLVYGPGVRANFRALMGLLRRGLPLPFGAIHNQRSFVGIENLVDILTRCIDVPEANGGTFLASDDEDLSTTTLLRRLGVALGVRARLLPVPASLLVATAAVLGQKERIRRLCENLQVDVSNTRRVLGWAPRVDVDEGFSMTAKHFLRETDI